MLQTHLSVSSPLLLDGTESMYFPEKPHCLERLPKLQIPSQDTPAGLSEVLPGILHSQETQETLEALICSCELRDSRDVFSVLSSFSGL